MKEVCTYIVLLVHIRVNIKWNVNTFHTYTCRKPTMGASYKFVVNNLFIYTIPKSAGPNIIKTTLPPLTSRFLRLFLWGDKMHTRTLLLLLSSSLLSHRFTFSFDLSFFLFWVPKKWLRLLWNGGSTSYHPYKNNLAVTSTYY